MLSNKTLYLTAFLCFLLEQAARSDTSSTQQITPTSCQGYLVPATTTETTSSEPLAIVVPETPAPVVISQQPTNYSPPANIPLSTQSRGPLTHCASAAQNCLTQEQAWPQPVNMYEDHRGVLGTLACIPVCWPVLVSILLYGQFCNPPFLEDSFELPACCQPQTNVVFPQTQLGTLAAMLSRHLNRRIWYSDILVLWLNQLLGSVATASLESYNTLSTPPCNTLATAVSQGITVVLPLPAISAIQQDTNLQEVSGHLQPFQEISAEQINHPYTDIVSILIFPLANYPNYQVIAIHQSNSSTEWMIIPQLQSSGIEPSGEGIDFIRRHLRQMSQSARIPNQPVIIIRLFIQRQ